MAAKSTGPTVNIQNTQAAEAEQVHTTAKLTVKTMSAGGQLDNAVALQEDTWGKTLGDPPERLDVLVTVFSSKQPQQCTSLKMLTAEKQAVAADVGLDETLSGSSAWWESAALTSVTDKKHEEGGDANTEGRVLKSKNEKDGFRFTVGPASIKDKKEEKLPSSGGEAAESRRVKALERQMGGERRQTEENGKRVHFSNEVQYYEDEEFPAELEDCIEEMDEELDEGSPPERQKILLDRLNRLPFRKEKLYYVQMDHSEDETKRTEESQMDEKVEELNRDGDEEQDLADKEQASAEREDGVAPAELWEEETDTGSNGLTPTEPLTSDSSLASPSEVTLHQLQWPPPHHHPPSPADTLIITGQLPVVLQLANLCLSPRISEEL